MVRPFTHSSESPALLCKQPQRYFDALADWYRNWKVFINAMKNKALLITKKRVSLLVPLTFDGVTIPYLKRNTWESSLTSKTLLAAARGLPSEVGQGSDQVASPFTMRQEQASLRNKRRLCVLQTSQ
jgi:hypothetical protein